MKKRDMNIILQPIERNEKGEAKRVKNQWAEDI